MPRLLVTTGCSEETKCGRDMLFEAVETDRRAPSFASYLLDRADKQGPRSTMAARQSKKPANIRKGHPWQPG